MPVPGLLKARNVVVPPSAAATLSGRSGRAPRRVGRRVCVCTSTQPGSTSRPRASSTCASEWPLLRSGPTSLIRPSVIATSALNERSAVTTVPPVTTRSDILCRLAVRRTRYPLSGTPWRSVEGIQERESLHWRNWRPQPATHGAPVHRESGAKHGCMRLHAAPICRAAPDNHPAAGMPCPPPNIRGNPRGEAAVTINGADERLNIDDCSLELNCEQRPSQRMKGEDVDDAAFTVDGERDLRAELPAIELAEHGGYLLVHGRVSRVQQSIEFSSPPAGYNVHSNVQSSGDPTNGFELQRKQRRRLGSPHRAS